MLPAALLPFVDGGGDAPRIEGADLCGEDLRDIELTGVELDRCLLRNADLSGAVNLAESAGAVVRP